MKEPSARNVIAPEWLVKRIKSARSDMQSQLDERRSINGPDPSPNKALEMRIRIGNYDEVLGWMKQAEKDQFTASLECKYR